MTGRPRLTIRTIESRQAELDDVMRQIHRRARELTLLRLRRKMLADKIAKARARRLVPQRPYSQHPVAVWARAYRAKLKARRIVDPYLGRRYEDREAA